MSSRCLVHVNTTRTSTHTYHNGPESYEHTYTVTYMSSLHQTEGNFWIIDTSIEITPCGLTVNRPFASIVYVLKFKFTGIPSPRLTPPSESFLAELYTHRELPGHRDGIANTGYVTGGIMTIFWPLTAAPCAGQRTSPFHSDRM